MRARTCSQTLPSTSILCVMCIPRRSYRPPSEALSGARAPPLLRASRWWPKRIGRRGRAGRGTIWRRAGRASRPECGSRRRSRRPSLSSIVDDARAPSVVDRDEERPRRLAQPQSACSRNLKGRSDGEKKVDEASYRALTATPTSPSWASACSGILA